MSQPALALRPSRILARPGLIFALYLLRLLLASLVAWSIVAKLASLTSAHQLGDRILFEQGGLFLLEALRLSRPDLPAEFQRVALVLLFAAYLGLVPLAGLLWSLSQEGRLRLRDLALASLRPLGTLSLLLGMALVAYAFLAGLALFTASSLGAMLFEAALLAQLGVFLAALLIAAAVGIVHDLARAHAVLVGATALDSARFAWAAFGMRPAFEWGARAAASVGLVGAAAWLAGEVGVASMGATLLVAIVHQLTLLCLVALRASWLSAAVDFVARPARAPQLEMAER